MPKNSKEAQIETPDIPVRSECKVYDRQPGERELPWLGFQCYLDLGPGRTMDAAYEKYRQSIGKVSASRATSHFLKWAADYQWRDRVEAYDRDQAVADRQLKEDILGDEYRSQVEKLQNSQLIAGQLNLESMMHISKKIRDMVRERSFTEDKSGLMSRNLEALARSLRIMQEIGSQQYSAALGLDQLLAEANKNGN